MIVTSSYSLATLPLPIYSMVSQSRFIKSCLWSVLSFWAVWLMVFLCFGYSAWFVWITLVLLVYDFLPVFGLYLLKEYPQTLCLDSQPSCLGAVHTSSSHYGTVKQVTCKSSLKSINPSCEKLQISFIIRFIVLSLKLPSSFVEYHY